MISNAGLASLYERCVPRLIMLPYLWAYGYYYGCALPVGPIHSSCTQVRRRGNFVFDELL
jgi:hypothetical protein